MAEAPRVQHVTVAGGRASYREAGAGFPVVICPGLGLTGRFYENSFEAFVRAGLRLIVPDLPGTGDTTGPATGVDAVEVAEFLCAFADALSLPPALYVGHSLGTQAVLLLALRSPACVAGLALAGPTGGHERFKLLHQVRGLIVESVRVSPRVIGAVARDYIHVSPARYLGTWIRHRRSHGEDRLSDIACPVLLIRGERDAVIDDDYVAALRRDVRMLEEVDLPDGSHALPRSQHGEFERAVIEFAQRICE